MRQRARDPEDRCERLVRHAGVAEVEAGDVPGARDGNLGAAQDEPDVAAGWHGEGPQVWERQEEGERARPHKAREVGSEFAQEVEAGRKWVLGLPVAVEVGEVAEPEGVAGRAEVQGLERREEVHEEHDVVVACERQVIKTESCSGGVEALVVWRAAWDF